MDTITPTRSYRCHYHPKAPGGQSVPADTGVMPFIQLKATNAETAQRAAHHITGCAIDGVERIEGGAA